MNKIIKVLIIIFCISIFASNCIYASESIIDIGKDWESLGGTGSSTTMDTSKLKDASSTLFNLFFDLGIGVVIIVGAFLGIKFMTSGVEEKAEVKKTLIPYLISSVILVGAYGIWKLIVTMLGDVL